MQDEAFELVVLGAGPAFTDRPDASGAAYLVRHDRGDLLLDLGQGSFPRLAAEMEPSGLRAILVSHLHPDHFVDLVPLRHYLRWHRQPPDRVRVIAPAGLEARLDGLHAETGFSSVTLDIEALRPGTVVIGPFEVQVARVTHTDDSYGFRVAVGGGRGLVYSGDCGRDADLDTLIRAGDTLLCEASFGPGPVPVGAAHLAGPEIGALAARTGVGDVLLTHILMDQDRAETISSVRRSFAGPIRFVDPGDRLRIG